MNLKFILFSLFFLVALSCQQTTKTEPKSQIIDPTKKNNISTEKTVDDFTCKTTFSPDIGWGYQILNHDAIYINQPHIPAVEGVKGFTDENDAIATAELIIYKLKNGVFPPTIAVDELDSLGVLNE